MKKLVITLILLAFCAGLALADSDIKAGNMLQNYNFQTADADPAKPEHWTIDDAIAPDFTYTAGELSFKNTAASGTVTPQYIYQDVDVSGATGRFYTVGLNIDAVDTFKVYKFMGLDEDNVNVQIQWLDGDGKVRKTEKTRGFLEHHFLFYSITDNDYAFESRVYCPRDSEIRTCRFCIYVAKGVYAQKVTINQAWMYKDKVPDPYIALGYTHYDHALPIVTATGNVVKDLEIGFEGFNSRSDIDPNEKRTPWFCFYPVMSPDKEVNRDSGADDPFWVAIKDSNSQFTGDVWGGFRIIPSDMPKAERYCLEMRGIYQGKETVLARDYFYYDPFPEGVKAGWELDRERRFKNRRNVFGTMFGVSLDLDRGYGDDYSVFDSVGAGKYLTGLESVGADLVFAKVNWLEDGATLYADATRFTPGCKWFYDISDHMYEKGLPYCDWFDIANTARLQGAGLMGFVACDNLGMPTLQDAVKYKEQLRSSDRKAVIANRLPGLSESEFGEAAIYSRTAGDAVILDLMPSDGSRWRNEVDFPIHNNIFDKKFKFDRPVIALTKASAATPKDMLRLMAYAREKKLAGLVFDVNPNNALTDNTLNPQVEWSNYAAAMLIKDFLGDDPSLIEDFGSVGEDYVSSGAEFVTDTDVVTITGTPAFSGGQIHVGYLTKGADEGFVIVSSTMLDIENNSIALHITGKTAGSICEIKNISKDGQLTAVQPEDIDSGYDISFNGLTVIYVHNPV